MFNINSNCISFFNTSSFRFLLDKNKFYLHNITKNIYYYTFTFSITDIENSNITDTLVQEIEEDIYDNKIYETYKIKSKIYKNTMDNLMLYNQWNRLNIYNYF